MFVTRRSYAGWCARSIATNSQQLLCLSSPSARFVSLSPAADADFAVDAWRPPLAPLASASASLYRARKPTLRATSPIRATRGAGVRRFFASDSTPPPPPADSQSPPPPPPNPQSAADSIMSILDSGFSSTPKSKNYGSRRGNSRLDSEKLLAELTSKPVGPPRPKPPPPLPTATAGGGKTRVTTTTQNPTGYGSVQTRTDPRTGATTTTATATVRTKTTTQIATGAGAAAAALANDPIVELLKLFADAPSPPPPPPPPPAAQSKSAGAVSRPPPSPQRPLVPPAVAKQAQNLVPFLKTPLNAPYPPLSKAGTATGGGTAAASATTTRVPPELAQTMAAQQSATAQQRIGIDPRAPPTYRPATGSAAAQQRAAYTGQAAAAFASRNTGSVHPARTGTAADRNASERLSEQLKGFLGGSGGGGPASPTPGNSFRQPTVRVPDGGGRSGGAFDHSMIAGASHNAASALARTHWADALSVGMLSAEIDTSNSAALKILDEAKQTDAAALTAFVAARSTNPNTPASAAITGGGVTGPDTTIGVSGAIAGPPGGMIIDAESTLSASGKLTLSTAATSSLSAADSTGATRTTTTTVSVRRIYKLNAKDEHGMTVHNHKLSPDELERVTTHFNTSLSPQDFARATASMKATRELQQNHSKMLVFKMFEDGSFMSASKPHAAAAAAQNRKGSGGAGGTAAGGAAGNAFDSDFRPNFRSLLSSLRTGGRGSDVHHSQLALRDSMGGNDDLDGFGHTLDPLDPTNSLFGVSPADKKARSAQLKRETERQMAVRRMNAERDRAAGLVPRDDPEAAEAEAAAKAERARRLGDFERPPEQPFGIGSTDEPADGEASSTAAKLDATLRRHGRELSTPERQRLTEEAKRETAAKAALEQANARAAAAEKLAADALAASTPEAIAARHAAQQATTEARMAVVDQLMEEQKRAAAEAEAVRQVLIAQATGGDGSATATATADAKSASDMAASSTAAAMEQLQHTQLQLLRGVFESRLDAYTRLIEHETELRNSVEAIADAVQAVAARLGKRTSVRHLSQELGFSAKTIIAELGTKGNWLEMDSVLTPEQTNAVLEHVTTARQLEAERGPEFADRRHALNRVRRDLHHTLDGAWTAFLSQIEKSNAIVADTNHALFQRVWSTLRATAIQKSNSHPNAGLAMTKFLNAFQRVLEEKYSHNTPLRGALVAANKSAGYVKPSGKAAAAGGRSDAKSAAAAADAKVEAPRVLTAAEKEEERITASIRTRAPIVCVMGHVDHGKTTLLDRLRNTELAAKEEGGITQSIAAFSIRLTDGEEEGKSGETETITFLDTPGHAAFRNMRSRGAYATDIIVLVVAADDGVMPQTVEALELAFKSQLPIVVAINKCDLEGVNPEEVRAELRKHGVRFDTDGGDGNVPFVEISAKTGQGFDELKATIALQAEMAELKAPVDAPAHAYVIESKKDAKSGVVVDAIVSSGTLKIGDIVVCGTEMGKVRLLTGGDGKRVKSVGPARPVRIHAFDSVDKMGADLTVVRDERAAQLLIESRTQDGYNEGADEADSKRQSDGPVVKEMGPKTAKRAARKLRFETERSLRAVYQEPKFVDSKNALTVPVLLKADVRGSLEAMLEYCRKLPTDEVTCSVIRHGLGPINVADIEFAAGLKASVFGFNVEAASSSVTLQAQQRGVRLTSQRIIYRFMDDLRDKLSELLPAVESTTVVGAAEVLQLFEHKSGSTGTKAGSAESKSSRIKSIVAGCRMKSGELIKKHNFRLVRSGKVIWTGKAESLRIHNESKEIIPKGTECGVNLARTELANSSTTKEQWDAAIQIGDIIECVTTSAKARVLDDSVARGVSLDSGKGGYQPSAAAAAAAAAAGN